MRFYTGQNGSTTYWHELASAPATLSTFLNPFGTIGYNVILYCSLGHKERGLFSFVMHKFSKYCHLFFYYGYSAFQLIELEQNTETLTYQKGHGCFITFDR